MDERKKIIRKIGDSIGIIINKEERDIYEYNVGDVVRIKFGEKVVDSYDA